MAPPFKTFCGQTYVVCYRCSYDSRPIHYFSDVSILCIYNIFIVHVIKKKHHNLCQKELRLKIYLHFNNVIIDHFIN